MEKRGKNEIHLLGRNIDEFQLLLNSINKGFKQTLSD